MIDASFVQAIVGLADYEPKTVEIGGDTYSSRPLHFVRPPELPLAKVMAVHTLDGLCDYVVANRDALNLKEFMVHVKGPDKVNLVSKVQGLHRQREYLITAELPSEGKFPFGQFMDTESMIVALQALFNDAGDRAALLALIANVKNEEVRTEVDSGVTQVVETKTGIALVAATAVPSMVQLAPFRTFVEVEQPISKFLVRARTGNQSTDRKPSWALFEADGGAWKNDAIASIRDFLKEKMPTDLAILA